MPAVSDQAMVVANSIKTDHVLRKDTTGLRHRHPLQLAKSRAALVCRGDDASHQQTMSCLQFAQTRRLLHEVGLRVGRGIRVRTVCDVCQQ